MSTLGLLDAGRAVRIGRLSQPSSRRAGDPVVSGSQASEGEPAAGAGAGVPATGCARDGRRSAQQHDLRARRRRAGGHDHGRTGSPRAPAAP